MGKTLSVAVLSGKGGVGKSNLSLNLGCALALRGNTVLLMDCDLGLASLDVLLGIAPEGNMQDVLLGKASMSDVIHRIEQNLDLLPAASGVPELANMTEDMQNLLLERLLPELERYDYVIMDAGAGINETVQATAAMAALRMVVVTPEPTSLTDGYALIKVLLTRRGIRDFLILVNQTESARETKRTFSRLSAACGKFLDIEPTLLASVRYDKEVPEAVRSRRPLLACKPECRAAADIRDAAGRLETIRNSMAEWIRKNPALRPLPKIGK
jgi:flagellar biosynthesis protein FlhG